MLQLAHRQDRPAGAPNPRHARRGTVTVVALGSLIFTTSFAYARSASESFADLARR